MRVRPIPSALSRRQRNGRAATHDWQTAGQWTTSGAPTSSDNAVIDASGSYTVKIDQAAAAHSLVVNNSGAKVEILRAIHLPSGVT